MGEIIEEKIVKLKNEREQVNSDYCVLLETIKQNNKRFGIDHHMINNLTNYSFTLAILDEKIKLLKEIQSEAQ